MTTRGSSWGQRARNALPWQDDEYLTVNGQRYLYSYDADMPSETIVHLPGRGGIALGVLKAQGCTIVEPVRWRKSDFLER